MRAKLKELYSPDIDVETFHPIDKQHFGFLLHAMIGPEGEDGQESFEMLVCTPDWLKSQHSTSDVVFGRHILIVFDYNIERIQQHISTYCDQCTGEDWESIAKRLNEIGRWEFEDYSHDPSGHR